MTREDIDAVVKVCLDMANRYDEDIEGCDGDELIKYGEGITCCFRLAHIFKYGCMPPKGDTWGTEFVAILKHLPRDGDRVISDYRELTL